MLQRSFISAFLYSIRPSACFGAALFATVGLGRWDNIFITALTFFAAFIGSAGCFLINDIFDREKDLKNNKLRPIATGEISVRTAYIISAVCCSVMLAGSAFLNLNAVFLAALLIALFWIYPYINQHFGLLANIWVSVCSALAFIYGALVYKITPLIYLAVLVTLFANMGREILLDVLDQQGDQAIGKPSIPLVYGEKRTKVIIFLLFTLASITLLAYWLYFPSVWLWVCILLLLLWVPFFMKRKEGYKKWALFNVRTSHIFFIIIIALLFIFSGKAKAQQGITSEYCLDRLETLQSKNDGFYPTGIFPTQRYWISKKPKGDNSVFGTAWVAYILRTVNERQPNERARLLYDRSIYSFDNYKGRNGEATYNFWQSVGGDVPYPNGGLLSGKKYRLPDDYDDTALIQLARGSNPIDKPVRDKMLQYAIRPERKPVNDFSPEYRTKNVYEVWYAKKYQQELDIVVMANTLLFVLDKGYSLEAPDRYTIDCLKTSIDEGWYFKDPVRYAQYYARPALIMYSLARLVAKDTSHQFSAQREVLIRHLRQALDQPLGPIDKVMIASSLLRLGTTVSLTLSRDQVIHDARSFIFTSYKASKFPKSLLPTICWGSEALSWTLMYELLSFNPTINWK